MASPIFDTKYLFDSTTATSHFSEGVLYHRKFEPIMQQLHFNGENGLRWLGLGYGDRIWTFEGIMSAPTASALFAQFQAIQDYIQAWQTSPDTRWSLFNSYGDQHAYSYIVSCDYAPPLKCSNGYYVTPRLIVQGASSGMS